MSLAPMQSLKSKMNVINGLFNKNSTGVGIHLGQTGNILSGASLQNGSELKGGISIDQMLANHLGQLTAQPSLVLDRVQEHAASLSRQVSATDRGRPDQYLASVREVEKRIERAREDQHKATDNAAEKFSFNG